MCRVLLIGNPNVGKTTLFNSLTTSCEHTGNFHGVTVADKHKIVNFNGTNYDFVDLPGIYSLNCFSFEEEVSKKQILLKNSLNIVLTDANSLRRNLYLCLQLSELGIKYKLLINNYDYFIKTGNNLNLNVLKQVFGLVNIVNAKKTKLTNDILKTNNKKVDTNYINNFLNDIKKNCNITTEQALLAINGEYKNLNNNQIELIKNVLPDIIKARYNFIDSILCKAINLKNNFVYGLSRADKFILNPFVMLVGFLLTFFVSIYCIFFLVGPLISDALVWLFNFLIIKPFMNLLYLKVSNVWVIEFFNGGVFSAFTTVLTFLPQVCLLFAFLTILEDSGIIARMAFVLDDFLSKFGLNGKSVYIMLLGLGCNTMSAMASRNMDEKNLKIKTAVLNPFISCAARLPVLVVVASAIFGVKAFLIVCALYLLGIMVALLLAVVLNKTILKNKSDGLLLEFPPLKNVDIKHVFSVVKLNGKDFVKRVFSVVLTVGIIVWLLTHTGFNFKYTQDITNSMLYFFASKITFVFAPIGLNSAGIVCALFTGLLAKELMLSIFTICNNVSTTKALSISLISSASLIHFTLPSAVAFLIFALLYSPCISTLAVIKKEAGKFWMWFSLIFGFVIAYTLAFIAYTALSVGWWVALIAIVIITLIMFAIIYIIKKLQHKKCWGCNKCK